MGKSLIENFVVQRLILFFCVGLLVLPLMGQIRSVQSLNDNWKFHRGGIAFANRDGFKGYPEYVDNNWESVQLPHTWNANDPFDDATSYYRGIAWYRKKMKLESVSSDERFFLRFEGAAFRTEVYVNGALAGTHLGGYTGFTLDITPYLTVGENLLAVMVDNSHNPIIAPLAIGYALYGGIYRDVWLIKTSNIHFEPNYFGADALFFKTPDVSDAEAAFVIEGQLSNSGSSMASVRVEHTLVAPEGDVVWQDQEELSVIPGKTVSFSSAGKLTTPVLWSPESPSLYTLESKIFFNDSLADELRLRPGFRWFALGSDEGFLLNGRPYELRGTNRHQDFKGMGDALDNAFHNRDLEWIKSMGANFLRLAHYPQDPYVYQLADEMGLLLWSEIPNLNFINPSESLTRQSALQIKEMIFQHFNHPSIVFWGSSNEILLWSEQGARQPRLEDKVYGQRVRDFVWVMDSTIRAADPHRLTTLAIHGSSDYDSISVTDIPDMLAVNLYDGWYGGEFDGFGRNLDSRRQKYPKQHLFVSEYGAGSDKRINAMNPLRFDFSGQYQLLFHEAYLRQIHQRKWLVGSAIWNQFDFSQPHTGGSINHVNQKGLQGFDRKPKDTYYFYKANWSDKSLVYLGIRDWDLRAIWTGKKPHPDLSAIHEIPVFSNMESVELFHNGQSLGLRQPNDQNIARWELEMKPGTHLFLASGKNAVNDFAQTDAFRIEVRPKSLLLRTGESLAINTGFHGEFRDAADEIWIPDAAYGETEFGGTGGKAYMFNKDVVFYGTRDRDPLYNYVLQGLSAYNLDVPDGSYVLELFFAEGEVYQPGKRVFDVWVNGMPFIKNLDIFSEYGFARAFSRSIHVEASGGTGIMLDFKSLAGEPFVSAIKITKL
jgi:beta-galactosidase